MLKKIGKFLREERFLIVILAVVIFGVVVIMTAEFPEVHVVQGNDQDTRLHREIDPEAGVVCYSLKGRGISCLPIVDTRLDR